MAIDALETGFGGGKNSLIGEPVFREEAALANHPVRLSQMFSVLTTRVFAAVLRFLQPNSGRLRLNPE
jgi:hypothetical protein